MRNIPMMTCLLFGASMAFFGASPTVQAYNFLHGTEFAEAVEDEERIVRNRVRTDDFSERTRNLEQQFAERQQNSGVSQLGRDTSGADWQVDTSRFERQPLHLGASVVSADANMYAYDTSSYVSGDAGVLGGDLIGSEQYIGPITDDMMIGRGGWEPNYLSHTGFETYVIGILALLFAAWLNADECKKLAMALKLVRKE